jgi:hypothetical protein
VDRAQRRSLDALLDDPWLNADGDALARLESIHKTSGGPDDPAAMPPVDDEVVLRLSDRYSLPADEVYAALKANDYNEITALYRIMWLRTNRKATAKPKPLALDVVRPKQTASQESPSALSDASSHTDSSDERLSILGVTSPAEPRHTSPLAAAFSPSNATITAPTVSPSTPRGHPLSAVGAVLSAVTDADQKPAVSAAAPAVASSNRARPRSVTVAARSGSRAVAIQVALAAMTASAVDGAPTSSSPPSPSASKGMIGLGRCGA